METSREILTELKEIAPGIARNGLSRVPFAVPTGYFEGFAEILMKRINREGNSEISSLEEISGISPLLAGLQKKNTYQAPEGYFETWKTTIPVSASSSSSSGSENYPSKLVAITTGKPQSNAVSYRQGSFGSKTKRISILPRIIRYAVAACLVGLLGITIYNVNNRNNIDPLHGLTTVSDQDMANYLDAGDIHWTPGLAPETASVDFTDNDIHTLFSNVSDAELLSYTPSLPLEKGTVN
jgi:hypothetical protein